jgi:hypothetical protein
MPGRMSHCGYREDWIIDRHLGASPDRGVIVAATDVIDSEHVRNKESIELPALKDFRETYPIAEILVTFRTIARMVHKPGDRCAMQLISNAFSRICRLTIVASTLAPSPRWTVDHRIALNGRAPIDTFVVSS